MTFKIKKLIFQIYWLNLKLQNHLLVVIFAGSKENTRGKFFAGIARACFRTDAVIIDSGISSGIELFSLRKSKSN